MKIFILAGDPSADRHASKLIKELKKHFPNAEYYGIGGPMMQLEGFNSIIDFKLINIVGFWEVAKKYTFFRNLLNRCKDILLNDKPDIFIPIDYPGFNMRLGKFAKSIGIRTVYYIAPQLWVWGKNRAKNLKDSCHQLLVIFPFEEAFFSKYSIETHFVGHPLLDDPKLTSQVKTIDERENILAILPGSRKQEIIAHADLISHIISNITSKSNMKIAIPISSNLDKEFVKKHYHSNQIEFFEDSYQLMQIAKVGLVKTGTSNLEAMLCGMPFAMFYKTSFLTYYIGTKIVNLEYISLVNIIKNQAIVKEFIQQEANPITISNYLIDLYTNPEKSQKLQDTFLQIRQELGNSGASYKAAKIIAESLKS